MSGPDSFAAGFEVPLHRSLTEPILLGGAPRTVAISNGTLAAAVGLGLQLWIPGVVLWIGTERLKLLIIFSKSFL